MSAPNWSNRTLFHGDNLKFLRAMNSESVDLIATDPPFNKGRDFHATPDSLAAGAKFQDRWSWERDVHEEWVDQIKDDYPRLMEAIESARYAHSDGMGAYMCFMAVRLLAMRRVLRPTGSIYLHCDPTASHYLKAVMDAIFGWKNFRNEVVWHYKSFHGQTRRYFAKKHDTFLMYSKTNQWTFNRIFEDDNTGTVDFKRWRNYLVGGRLILGGHMPAHDTRFVRFLNRWRRENEREPGPEDVVYEVTGQALDTVWHMKPVDPKDKRERVGYPTQKPLALYERIIKASSNEDDIVLDPFAGCATTCVAAERLGRQWVGIDIWENAADVVIDRLNREGLFLPGDADRVEDSETQYLFAEDFHFTDQPPERTDDGETAAPFLRVRQRVKEPPNPFSTRAAMLEFLLEQNGPTCEGCGRTFDDPRYLQLDHNTPRADGGWNHISNRILLCGPCNILKSNIYTLSGLIRENKKRGYMTKG